VVRLARPALLAPLRGKRSGLPLLPLLIGLAGAVSALAL